MAVRRQKQKQETIDLEGFIDEYRAGNEGKDVGQVANLDEMCNIYGFEFRNALPLQWLFGCNVFPLGRAVLVVGEPAGGKTQFAVHIAELCASNGGLIHYTETEGKLSKSQIYGLFGADKERVHRHMSWKFAKTMEIAQETIMATTNTYEETCQKYNRWPPYLNIVDSIAGITSQKAKDKINDAGSAGMDTTGMHNAASWKKYFQVFVPDHVSHMPFGMIIVNHEGEDIDMNGGGGGFGGPSKNTGQGGKHKDYMSSMTLSMSTSKVVQRKIGNDTAYGPHSRTRYYAKNVKNCLGVKGSRIEYEVIAYRDADRNTVLKYDWNSALVDMLSSDSALNLPSGSVSEVLDLRGGGQKWSCPLAGVPHPCKEHPDTEVDKETMGQLLHSTPEAYEMIQKQIFNVDIWPVWGDPSTEELAMTEINLKLKERADYGDKPKTKRQRRK